LAGLASSMSICNPSIHQIAGLVLSSLLNIVLTYRYPGEESQPAAEGPTPEAPTVGDNEASPPPYSELHPHRPQDNWWYKQKHEHKCNIQHLLSIGFSVWDVTLAGQHIK
jgi:hypothetical protein